MTDLDILRKSIMDEFSSAWELNDTGHRLGHFLEVETCGNYINTVLKLGHDPKLILLVAFFHDLFAWSRFNHHLLSGEYVDSTNHRFFQDLSVKDRLLVAAGCREHRASRTEPFSCGFAELMSSADRGFPGDANQLLQRAIKFRTDRGESGTNALEGAVDHIKEKYGTGGYARYPQLYLECFKHQLECQRRSVDAM